MKAIFFDASGVLYYRRDKQGAMRAFLERHHLPAPPFKQVRQARADAHARASIGELSREAYFDAVLAAWGVIAPALQAEGHQVLAAARRDFVLYDGVVEMVQTLWTRGFKLGIVTDTVTPTAETLRCFAHQGYRLGRLCKLYGGGRTQARPTHLPSRPHSEWCCTC
jgi:FMN phosphatase YigB (HAD superfamily)